MLAKLSLFSLLLITPLLVRSELFPDDCNELFRVLPPGQQSTRLESYFILKLKEARSFNDFFQTLELLKNSSNRVALGQEAWKASPFLKRGVLTLENVSQYLKGTISREELESIIVRQALAAFSRDTSVKEFVGLLRISKKSGIIDVLPENFLLKNPLVQKGLLDPEELKFLSEKQVKEAVYDQLVGFSKRAQSYPEYLDLIHAIKHSDYSGEQLTALLQPMTKLGSEFGNLIPFIESIKNSLRNGRLDINRFIGNRLIDTMELYYRKEKSVEFINLLSTIKGGHPLVVVLSRLSKVDFDITRQLESLARSDFAKNHGLSVVDLKNILSSMKKNGTTDQPGAIEEIGRLRPHLAESYKLRSLDNYDRSLNITSIKNQCRFGACWVHSPIEKYEIELSARLGQHVELSTDYFYYHHLRSQYKQVLRSNNPSYAAVKEGGHSALVPQLIKEYGLVPKRIIPEDTLKVEKLEGYSLELFNPEKVPELQAEMKTLFEKFQRDIYNFETLEAAIENYDRKIDETLSRYYVIPEDRSFIFQGRRYTPESFSQEYLSDILNSEYEVVTFDASMKNAKVKNQIFKADGTIKEIKAVTDIKDKQEISLIIKESLDQGKAVQVNLDWPGGATFTHEGQTVEFINRRTGMMTAPVDKTKILPQVYQNAGGHAVLVVGYELDEAGSIVSYKILNSWGNGSGDHGFYHADEYFFEHFLKSINVDRKTGLGFWENPILWIELSLIG
jgi:aminopeptidase C